MYTHSGQRVTTDDGSPTLDNIALGLGRTVRFQGHGKRLWTNLQHSLVVGDLCAYPLLGYLHDAAEVVLGDINACFKTAELREVEERIWRRILWDRFGIESLPADAQQAIKLADDRTLAAEGRIVGPPGLAAWCQLQYPHLSVPDEQADERVRHWLARYQITDLMMEQGQAMREYKQIVEAAWKAWQSKR